MQAEQLYHLLQQQPFPPLRVYLQDGRTLDIPRRDLAVVGVTYLAVGVQASDEPPGIMASSVTIPLTEIQRVESLTQVVPPVTS